MAESPCPVLRSAAVLTPSLTEFNAAYKVQGKIGEGAFAEIYRLADAKKGGRSLALKVLRPSAPVSAGDCNPEVLFFREARALQHASGHR